MLARMKQRSNNNVCYYYSDDSDIEIDEDEYQVAEILCQLPQIILRSTELSFLFNLSWGSKRRRTEISASPLPSSVSSPTHQPQPPAPLVLTYQNSEEEEPILKVKKDTSPDTPLSFSYSHSESDSKRKPHKRKASKKKTKEEWEEALIKVSDQNDAFKKAIVKVMEHYENLLAQNLRIKAKKQELSNCQQRDGLIDLNSSSGRTSLDLFIEPAESTVTSSATEQQESNMVYEQPPQNDHKPFESEIFENSQYPYGQMPISLPADVSFAMAQHLGSLGIDLNFTADLDTTTSTDGASAVTSVQSARCSSSRMSYIQPLDLRKAVLTAEARRRRFEMTKAKKSMANSKTRLQIR